MDSVIQCMSLSITEAFADMIYMKIAVMSLMIGYQ